MVHKRNVIAARLPQPEFDGRWGLRSALDGRWLPVVYASEAEASAAASGPSRVARQRQWLGAVRAAVMGLTQR